MMLKHHQPFYNFMGRMRRSYKSKQVNLQKLSLSRLHQTRTNKLYVNLPIPKISSQKVASLIQSKRELTYVRKTGGIVARTSGTEERTSGTKEKAGGTDERTGGTKGNYKHGRKMGNLASFVWLQRTGGTEERSGGTEARTGGTIEKIGRTKDYCRKLNFPIPKLSSQEVDPLVRVRRDLSQSGTDERTGGTKERTGGTEERNDGTEERTGSTEDSYKQWRNISSVPLMQILA